MARVLVFSRLVARNAIPLRLVVPPRLAPTFMGAYLSDTSPRDALIFILFSFVPDFSAVRPVQLKASVTLLQMLARALYGQRILSSNTSRILKRSVLISLYLLLDSSLFF